MRNLISSSAPVLLALSLWEISPAATSAIRIVNTDVATALKDAEGVPLDSGTPNTQNGNGYVFQLGYFSTSTANFEGTWMPIAGAGSTNPSLSLHIGDFNDLAGSVDPNNHFAVPDGLYSIEIQFDSENGTASGLPAADTQLALRFYDGTTTTDTNYNTVTSDNWKFVALDVAQTGNTLIDTNDPNATLVFEQGGAGNDFRTVIAVPEPSSSALLGLGMITLLVRRRK